MLLLWVKMPWFPAVPCVLNLEGKLASAKGVDSNRAVSILSSSIHCLIVTSLGGESEGGI